MIRAHNNLLWTISMMVFCASIIACGGDDDGSITIPNPDPISTVSPEDASVLRGDTVNPEKWLNLDKVQQREDVEWVSEVSTRGINDQSELVFLDFSNPRRAGIDRPELSIKADVTVNKAENRGALLRAFIQGRFYRSFIAAEKAGEVIANIDIRQQPDKEVLEVAAYVVQCADFNCNSLEPIAPNNLEPFILGTVTLGERHTLSINFNSDKKTFTFKVGNLDEFIANVPAVAEGLREPIRILGTSITEIESGKVPVEEGVIKASFDNLIVNGLPMDDFNSDTTLSRQDGLVRRVNNGVLEIGRSLSKQRKDGKSKEKASVNLQHIDAFAIDQSIKADMKIKDESEGENVETSVGLVNSWYHATDGDVKSSMSLTNKGQVHVQIRKGNELLEDKTFPVDISKKHTLAMDFDANSLNFNLDDTPLHSFNVNEKAPLVNANPLNVGDAGLSVNISGVKDNEDKGLISAEIDNVFIDEQLYDDFKALTEPRRSNIPLREEDESRSFSIPPVNISI